MKTMVANFRGPQVPKGRNLRRVLLGITLPSKCLVRFGLYGVKWP